MTQSGTIVKAQTARARLSAGNVAFAAAGRSVARADAGLREQLVAEGQHPFAAVLACADSRVVPEDIFLCNLGELFVVRVAGNVAGDAQTASMAYAVEHLGVKLVVVLGHTHCGAVGAVLGGADEPALAALCEPIARAIGQERDERAATVANVRAAVEVLNGALSVAVAEEGVCVVGALYHTGSGEVEWL